jgi:Glutamine amidotransferase domain
LCGLVGVAGDLYKKEIDAFNQLLYADKFRGAHATGVGAFNVRTGTTSVLKRALVPEDLMNLKQYDSIVNTSNDVLIGHNRFGTRGDNGAHRNAHPFDFPDVMGAHNGTLDYWCQTKLHDNNRYDTDSEALYSDINQNTIQETIPKLGGDSAWALTFVDKQDKTINLLRNDKRPLWYVHTKDRKAMFWASEVGLLIWILNRNGIEMDPKGPVLLPIDQLHTWGIPTTGQMYADDPEVEEIKGTSKNPHVYAYQQGGGANVNVGRPFPIGRADVNTRTSGTQTGSGKSSVVRFPQTAEGLSRWRPPYKFPDGTTMTKPTFEMHASEGCVYCNNDALEWGKPVKFYKPDSRGKAILLCHECLAKPDAVQMTDQAYG